MVVDINETYMLYFHAKSNYLLLYNGEIIQSKSVSQSVNLPFFEPNQNSHNSVNFEAMVSRFCMVVDLVEEQMMTPPRTMTRRRMTTTTTTMTTTFFFVRRTVHF